MHGFKIKLLHYMTQRNGFKNSDHFGKYFHKRGLQDEKWVRNADAVYYSDILMKNFISEYEIVQGVCEDYELTPVAEISLLIFPKRKKGLSI